MADEREAGLESDVPRYWDDVPESEGVWDGDGWQVPERPDMAWFD